MINALWKTAAIFPEESARPVEMDVLLLFRIRRQFLHVCGAVCGQRGFGCKSFMLEIFAAARLDSVVRRFW